MRTIIYVVSILWVLSTCVSCSTGKWGAKMTTLERGQHSGGGATTNSDPPEAKTGKKKKANGDRLRLNEVPKESASLQRFLKSRYKGDHPRRNSSGSGAGNNESPDRYKAVPKKGLREKKKKE